MFTNYNKYHLLLIFFVLIGFKSFSQLSTVHYIPPLTSAEFGNANPEDQYIYISTPNAIGVNCTIKPIGQTEFTRFVSSTAPAIIPIGSGNGQLFVPSPQTSLVTNNKGYIIEAERPVYVSIRMQAGGGAQAGALVSKGASALDTTFRIGSYTNEAPQDNYLSFVSVMASEDNTQVSFDNLPAGLVIKNYSGTIPISITLNEGESYTVATNSLAQTTTNRDGLIGCLVTSDKPIAVNCGSANGSFGGGGGRDYGIDQIAGLSKIGTEYIFVKGGGNNDWENVLIVPHTPGTTVSINGGAATAITGPYLLIEGNQFTNDNMYIQTSQPVFAYQGVGSNSEANQGMFFVPPLSCETRGNIDNIANIDEIGSTPYVGGLSIVTKVGATVTINNLALSNFSTIGPSNVDGKTDYITYKITGLSSNVSVQGDDELYVAYFNVNGAATSGSFYSGFPSKPEINFDAQFATLGNCIPNVTLEAANADNFDSYEWYYDDGSGFQILASNIPSITPTTPGRYKLIGEITCTGERLESVEVPVSICPDDIDNDGIIDNIDLDNDNDGILNCTESRGDVTLDLSNTRPPRLIFEDGAIDSSIATDNITTNRASTGTSSVRLTGTGNIISEIPADSNAENNYDITFTETVNIKLSEDITYVHSSIDGEYFIAKVTPVNKNITLVDPDDRLLIDSNFDGLFETGVTQISGSEIYFKYNPTPSGNTPFEFFANQVEGFSFAHILQNITETSNFQANISLTCFKKDTDNDGIKDELDLDSDNDGIPDFIENSGTIIPLLNIDADANGVDDAYDITAIPIDTDNDGVLDYLDLDSDNDGIYDLIETGQLGTLSDTDLNGIEDGPTYGTNGWADSAETAPDSGVIGYILDDIDTDTTFNYIDLDSDGDSCSDVIEAGFSDPNSDNYLGDIPITVNSNGLVTSGTDGYILPNANYADGAPITITTQPTNPSIVCEGSNIIISVISPEAETYQWEEKIGTGNWTTISDGTNYSGSITNDLNIIGTPIGFNTYQYRVKLDRTGNSCGLYSDEITLTVDDLPIANTASTMRLCDDDNNGTMPFNLTLQNSDISNLPNRTITYHRTQAAADSHANDISDFSNFESGNTTIYARVENDNNPTCFATSSFNLEVYDSAFPLDSSNILPLTECDNNSFGTDTDGIITQDLTQKEIEILNGQNSTNFTLTYFTDASYLNQIPNPASYTNNTSPNTQIIYVRVTNNLFSNCYTDTSFEIEIFELPVVNNPNIYSQCDDDSNDGQAFFNLTLDSIKEEINSNYTTEGLTFKYYDDQNEANTDGTTIPDPANYQDALGFTTETVWIRAENPNNCFRVVPLLLEVSPSSGALSLYNPTPLYQCDDGLDLRDGISTFNMKDIEDHISDNIFPTFNVTVHFFESQSDAELETNEITNIENHENTNSPNFQNIWVRVKSDLGNNCLGLEEFPNLLNVEALPVANPVSINRQCDHDTNDAILNYPFDTSNLEANVLNGQNASNVTITYFDSNGNPLLYSDGSAVTSPIDPTFLSENQTITIIVTNNSTQDPDGPCFDSTTLEFIIDKQPVIADTVPPLIVCDGDDGDVDDDGFYPFNLSNIQNTILGTQTDMDIFYTYVNENGTQVTETTLPNELISENQSIFIEVINPINNSCSANTSVELIVNPLPEFTVDDTQIVCTSDPTFTVDLSVYKTNIVDNFNYIWTWSSLDGSVTDNFVSNNETISVSSPGIYKITAFKTDGTGCSRRREVLVDASERATITMEDVTIVDISENNSVSIDPTNLGSGNYEYGLREEGSAFTAYQTEPIFENINPGFYTIYVKDDICGISTLDISVIGHAKFFTPNGDGKNDYWQIKGVNALFQSNSNILILDRYGKLLKQINPLSDGWDGSIKGKLMPTDDYWFRVLLEDGRTFMGHFTLKR